MSTATNTLNKVKTLLGLEVSLEQMKLDNGTVIEAEAFEADQAVFIVTEDEKVALPVGEYTLEDGRVLTVAEEGVIAEIAEAEAEAEPEAEVEVEAEQIEVEAEEVEAADENLEYVTREELVAALEEVKAMIDEVKAGYEEKMSTEVEATENVEDTEEQEELKAELSKPAAAPLKHSPEREAKKEVVRFAKRKAYSTLDNVFSKLNK